MWCCCSVEEEKDEETKPLLTGYRRLPSQVIEHKLPVSPDVTDGLSKHPLQQEEVSQTEVKKPLPSSDDDKDTDTPTLHVPASDEDTPAGVHDHDHDHDKDANNSDLTRKAYSILNKDSFPFNEMNARIVKGTIRVHKPVVYVITIKFFI